MDRLPTVSGRFWDGADEGNYLPLTGLAKFFGFSLPPRMAAHPIKLIPLANSSGPSGERDSGHPKFAQIRRQVLPAPSLRSPTGIRQQYRGDPF